MRVLAVYEKDLHEKFIKGSGSGGQKVNKTSSCVYLRHAPSGLEVKCQRSRSLQENRFFARRLIASKIEKLKAGRESEEKKKINKIKKQKRKRSKRSKAKVSEFKKQRSKKKKFRSERIDLELS